MKRIIQPLFALWLGVTALALPAAELRDVSWMCKSGACSLVFQFDPAAALPSYFQKYDATRKVLRIAFSGTGIQVPMGSWTLDANSTGMKGLNLRNEATTRGTPILAFDWSVGSDIHSDQNAVSLEKNGRFVIKFPTKSPNLNWNLLSASKTSASKVIVPVSKAKIPTLAPVVVPPPAPSVSDPKLSGSSLPVGIHEISRTSGFGLEQCVFQFDAPISQNIRVTDTALFIPLPKGARVSILVKMPASSVVRSFRSLKSSLGNVDLMIATKGKPDHWLIKGKRLIFLTKQVPVPGFDQWILTATGSSHHVFQNAVNEDEFENLDKFAQGIPASSASANQIFALRKMTRDLIVIEDLVVLRDSPSEVGKQLLELKFGDHVQAISLENLYYKVKSKDVQGYVNRRMVGFPDELNKTDLERIKSLASAQKAANEAASAAGLPSDSSAISFDQAGEDRVIYSSFGRRDPFIQLKGVVSEGINIDGVELVGIIWEAEVPMVLLSDTRNPGVSYTLKEGDPILNGKVLKITQDEVLFLINEFGVSRRYTMTLPDKYGVKK